MRTTTAGGEQGGGCLVVRDRPQGWSVELMRFHDPNVVRCEVFNVTDRKRKPVIGAYLPPSTLEHLPDLEESLTSFREHYPIVLGDISANFFQSHNPRSHQVADLLMKFRMIDLFLHLRQRWWFRKTKTWYWVRQGRGMQKRSDHIMGTDRQRFKMVRISFIRNYPSYNFVLQARVLIFPTKEGHHYNAGGPPEKIETVYGGKEENRN